MRLKYEDLGAAIAATEFMARRNLGWALVVEVYEDQDIGDLFLVDAAGWNALADEIQDPKGAAEGVFVHYEVGRDPVEEVA